MCEEGVSAEEPSSSVSLRGISLIDAWGEKTQLIVGRWSSKHKKGSQMWALEQVRKQFFSTGPASAHAWAPAVVFLSDELWAGSVSQKSLFFSKLVLVSALLHQLKPT